MGCSWQFAKVFLMIYNIFFLIIGLILLIGGAVIQGKFKGTFDLYQNGQIVGVAIVLIIAGLLILFLSVLGFLSAWREYQTALFVYVVIVGILLVCQIGAGIAGGVLKDNIVGSVTTAMNDTMKSYNESNIGEDGNPWNLQKQLGCCGIDSYGDWFKVPYGKEDKRVPKSCCKDTDCVTEHLLDPDTAAANIYTVGCLTLLQDNLGVLAGIALTLMVIQVVGLVVAILLWRHYKKGYYGA